MRRLLALVALSGLLVAGTALSSGSAGAQPTPEVSINPTRDNGGSSGTWSIAVSGQNWRAGRQLSIGFGQDAPRTFTPGGTSFTFTITPARRVAGTYGVTVTQDLCDFDSCPVQRTAFFESVAGIALEPPCSTTGTSQSLVVRGFGWRQFPVSITYDYPSNNVQTFTPAANGDFARTFPVTPPNRDVVIFAEQPRMEYSTRAVWPPCPPGPTTTTTTTSTTMPDEDTTTTSTTTTSPDDDPGPEPDDTPTPTTQPVPDTPGTPVTIPPTIDLPPPTPGATLTVAPEIGTAGFVTGAVGTGFPPGPVTITWQPGIGATTAVAGPDGTFRARVLVFPNDRLGARALVAIGGATTAYDAFLVVQSSVQPSGQNVRQINRIRQFNQR